MAEDTLPYSNGKLKVHRRGNECRTLLQRLVTMGTLMTITWNFPFFRTSILRNRASDDTTLPNGSIRFFSIGDWGVVYCEELYKTGMSSAGHRCTGDGQLEVANAMASHAEITQPDFILSLGDNFYDVGVESVEDLHWKKSFEEVYSHSELRSIPWWVILGDHDHRRNVSAQILYSKFSDRWNFPSQYYAKSFLFSKSDEEIGKLTLLCIDNILLEGSEAPMEDRRFGSDFTENFSGKDAAIKQWQWLETTLAESQMSDYIIVVGHRPVISGCLRDRNPSENAVSLRLLELIKQYRVDLYIGGHDHTVQHLYDYDTHFVTNGLGGYASHKVEYKPFTQFARTDIHGFFVHEVSESSMTNSFIDSATGKEIYSFSIPNKLIINQLPSQ